MTATVASIADQQIQRALTELRSLILARYPRATFTVSERDDPPGIYLVATVDVEDTDDVIDTYIERMVAIQIEEGLPVYAVVVQPLERAVAIQDRRRQGEARSTPAP